MRTAPRSVEQRGTAVIGQCPAQPIVATKAREFNRPASSMSLADEPDQLIRNWRAAAHIKMIQC
ncbi:hypothetical protein DF153_01985 [Burkholderia cenocepacia]|nr:hypothetical protein DF152_06515 [Burkholderia cenocepacia]RQU27918.1 hypothetical protein DF153_01985 [Burkholderia cenocepacia]